MPLARIGDDEAKKFVLLILVVLAMGAALTLFCAFVIGQYPLT